MATNGDTFYYAQSSTPAVTSHYALKSVPAGAVDLRDRRMWLSKAGGHRPSLRLQRNTQEQETGGMFSRLFPQRQKDSGSDVVEPDDEDEEEARKEDADPTEESALTSDQEAGALFDNTDEKLKRSPNMEWAHARRNTRLMACGLFMVFLIMVCNVFMLIALYSDSRMLEDRLHRVDKWMDYVDASHLLDVHLPNTMITLESTLPRLNATAEYARHTSEFADEVADRMRADGTVTVAHNLMVEARQFLELGKELITDLNHTLAQGRLTFEVPISP